MKYLVSLIFLLNFYLVKSQNINELKNKINKILENKNATVGVAIESHDSKETISINGDKKFPLQSVFKYHIALKVLEEVDKGKFTLNQRIKINKSEVEHELYSPIREKYPNGTIMKLSKIIKYTVSESDNTGCDLLLKLIGGPKTVETYLKQKGINDVAINYNEKTQQSEWNLQFENWITPKAANKSLSLFFTKQNNQFSNLSYNFIWETMKETETGLNRLKGYLPKNVIVAHKTGSSGVNKEGITAAVNDIGVIILPNGKYYFISVFVTESKENSEINERIIAEISKATYDYFNKK